MGHLKDEVYEKLDYLSQLTEVVISPQNEVLATLPDRIEFDYNKIVKFKMHSWSASYGFEIRPTFVLNSLVSEEQKNLVDDVSKFFKFEVSNDFELDLVNKSMAGTVALVKTVSQIDEKKILELAVDRAINNISSHDWTGRNLRQKAISVLNVFEPGSGPEWAKNLTGRIPSHARMAIREALRTAILDNKWRIRDTALITKISEWINSYMKDDTDKDLGLVNLHKLKIMLDKDLPVYSIDEVKNVCI